MPLAPLLERFGGHTGEFAKAAGVNRRTVQRWCKQGGLSFLKADRICCKVHEIPAHVWLDWHLDDAQIADAAVFALTLSLTQLS